MTELELILLGTGGGRFCTITQRRRTAGIRLLCKDINLHLDPGPGALIHSLNMGLDPRKIRAVLVSHAHPDHYTDAEILIEAMTRGMTRRRGLLAASHSVLGGNDKCGPAISKYHQQRIQEVVEAKPGVEFKVGDLGIKATRAVHSDPDTVGFRFETNVGDIGYTSDTELFDGLEEAYRGVRLLLLCLLRPSGEPWKGHMTPDDALQVVEQVDPEIAVITHFGMKMISAGPRQEAERIEGESGIRTLAAWDGLHVRVSEEILIGREQRPQKGLDKFAP
ncbi:MBL fold metallo-hydrolase [Candidatus Bathyarchaeota archaeon]|nr:MBL fold metallo-hydrolase [Candidatus Bathyarchaeota archaeon]NIU80933.1 MBL fold metallo-hydrolase [Candidatus Bathyarchaeota archaeon]NIV67589.1 MBL fold metallo-hydrolase [Candidatus Bathyarchaeota archaeon]NIW16112.1 MBL fold metallo-hydrolase [Candidatus Bathyarchaeota archaeon]NIW34218.1 MBL fold metallo-hydrolase [Candidatus Bathyarchaeota archaeon]